MKRSALVAILVVLLMLVVIAAYQLSTRTPPSVSSTAGPGEVARPAETKLVDVHDVSEFRRLFNGDRGKVRLILFVAPT